MILPKAVLHDHLDGSIRPTTLLDLAEQAGVTMPVSDPEQLATWFNQSGSGSLVEYLKAFDQTVAVLQTQEAIERTTFEAAEDHHADGVHYLELRYAAELTDLPLAATIEAMLSGARRAEASYDICVRVIVDAMRQGDRGLESAKAAVTGGAAGFDLAGPESGFPASRLADACRYIREHGLGLTIHAGEADGPGSIADALSVGAQRIGHGVRIIEDCVTEDGTIVDLGPTASIVHADQIPLEVCITSNLQTMNIAAVNHPVGMLYRAGFTVTLNTDNPLMSATSMSAEFELARQAMGFSARDFGVMTRNALRAGFADENRKQAIWDRHFAHAYANVSY